MIFIFFTLLVHTTAWTNESILAKPELYSIPSDAGPGEGVVVIYLSSVCAGSTALFALEDLMV